MLIIGEVKNTSGIYLITNLINGKVYVGSSVDIRKRMNAHKSHLNNNKHDNPYLQKSWNKYGSENFTFTVLEVFPDRQNLLNREQYWMDNYQSYNNEIGYNINPIAGSPEGRKLSDEEREKRSLSSTQKRRILQLDSKGKLIKVWDSIADVSKQFNINRGTLVSRIKNKTIFNNIYFIYEHEYSNNLSLLSTEEKKRLTNNKPFLQFDLEGNLIKEWVSIAEMNREFTFSISTISVALKNKSKFQKKYYLIPKDEFTNELLVSVIGKKQKKHKGKKVNQYSKNGEFIQTWDAIKHASDVLYIDKKSIDYCCKGMYKQAGGFIWSYAN
jgi:hypothetical protein